MCKTHANWGFSWLLHEPCYVSKTTNVEGLKLLCKLSEIVIEKADM